MCEEREYESSVSRTYYAMFYSAQAMLLTKNLSFSSHKGVISAFGEQFVKTSIFPKEMGRELNKAFEKRQLGDYEYTFVIAKREAEEILENGEKFIEKIIHERTYDKRIPPDKLEEDVEFLFEKIEDIHPNPSPYLEVKNDVLEKIDRPMN